MEIKINELNHDLYSRVVEYIGQSEVEGEEIKEGVVPYYYRDTSCSNIFSIEDIASVSGNPPVYTGVTIEIKYPSKIVLGGGLDPHVVAEKDKQVEERTTSKVCGLMKLLSGE